MSVVSVTSVTARRRGSRRLSTVTAIGMLGNDLRSVHLTVNVRRVAHSHFSTLRFSRFSANAKCHVPILGERRTTGVERHDATLDRGYNTWDLKQPLYYLSKPLAKAFACATLSKRAMVAAGAVRIRLLAFEMPAVWSHRRSISVADARSFEPIPARERTGYDAREAAVASRSPRLHGATMR